MGGHGPSDGHLQQEPRASGRAREGDEPSSSSARDADRIALEPARRLTQSAEPASVPSLSTALCVALASFVRAVEGSEKGSTVRVSNDSKPVQLFFKKYRRETWL